MLKESKINQEQIDNWAELIGDFNPIHVDSEYAQMTEFGGTIAHGTMILALCEDLIIEQFGEDWVRSGSVRVRFVSPARPGDELRFAGVLDGGVMKIACKNQNDKEILRGVARINK